MKPFSAQHRTQTLSGYETTGNPVVVRTQKERPILFSGPMVRATLEDRKSQTRRAVNPQPTQLAHLANGETISEAPYWTWRPRVKRGKCLGTTEKILKEVMLSLCPYGGEGDRLYVKETFRRVCSGEIEGGEGKLRYGIQYQADNHIVWQNHETIMSGGWSDTESPMQFRQDIPWKPSIFMPRRFSRIMLEITEVRVERLNEITEEDAMAEGVDWKDYAGLASKTAKKLFAQLWDSINGKTYPWSSNPWVFVIAFKRV